MSLLDYSIDDVLAGEGALPEHPPGGETDPEALTPQTVIGRPGRTMIDVLANGQGGAWVSLKDGCPFAPVGRGWNAKGQGLSYKVAEDGCSVLVVCRDPAHRHGTDHERVDRDGNKFWMWTYRDKERTKRKYPVLERGDHVEIAERVLRLLGDVELDDGDLIRRYVEPPAKGAPSEDAGTWVAVHKDAVLAVVRSFSGEWVHAGTTKDGKPKFAEVKLTGNAVESIYLQVVSMLRASVPRANVTDTGKVNTRFSEDRPNPLIAYRGGILEVTRTVRVVPYNEVRDCYIRSGDRIGARYDRTRTYPREFLRFLDTVWAGTPDYRERVLFLQEWLGLALAGWAVRGQVHVMMQGTAGGSNGKSTLIDIVNALFPARATSSVPMEKLGDRFSLMNFAGSRLNTQAEIPTDRLIDSTMLKSILTADYIEVDRKFAAPLRFKPQAAWLVGCNESWTPSDRSGSTFRRWCVLSFPNAIPEEQRDADLAKRIIANELTDLLGWALEGLTRWHHQGQRYTSVPSSVVAKAEWLREVDPIAEWCQDHLEQDPKGVVRPREHYNAFKEWAKEGGRQPVSEQKFSKAVLNRYGVVKGKSNGFEVHRIRIKESAGPQAATSLDDLLMLEN
ncbi:MAG: phage/plasmid primase, P4 family [Pseudomonadota bacterium]|nr:phage/plasmid primase, P4 family [Pseudomonadota bacterium]